MVKFPAENRVECLNQIRPGKICGAHLSAGKTYCPVCGQQTTTRRVDGEVGHERQLPAKSFRSQPPVDYSNIPPYRRT